jgi:hypothetical protein
MSASKPSKTNSAARRPALKDPLRIPRAGVPRLGTADSRFDFGRSPAADISGPDAIAARLPGAATSRGCPARCSTGST